MVSLDTLFYTRENLKAESKILLDMLDFMSDGIGPPPKLNPSTNYPNPTGYLSHY